MRGIHSSFYAFKNMSYFSFSASGCCKIQPCAMDDLVNNFVDYCVQSSTDEPDDNPFEDCEADDIASIVQSYISLDGDILNLELDSEKDNFNPSVFSSLIDYFSRHQVSDYLTVKWYTYDSRDGSNHSVQYYNHQGKCLDLDDVLKSHASAQS